MSTSNSRDLDWSKIKVFAMDVDGILTDGCIYLSSDGSETKRFSIVDGLGLVRLIKAGIHIAWISGRGSEATNLRAKELKVPHVIQGRIDKITALKELLEELGIPAENTAYMGDDVIDTDAIAYAGIGISVPEGQDSPKQAADYVTSRTGGNGAVREVCNHILAARELIQ